jgi:hypothetical protein
MLAKAQLNVRSQGILAAFATGGFWPTAANHHARRKR